MLVVQSSTVDQRRNTVSLFNILEEIQVPQKAISGLKAGGFVQVGPPFQCVCSFVRSDDDVEERLKARMEMKTPQGKVSAYSEFEVVLTGGVNRARAIVEIPALIIDTPGIYKFEVSLPAADGYSVVGSTEIAVKFVEDDEAQQA
jgi:hypothetical protein